MWDNIYGKWRTQWGRVMFRQYTDGKMGVNGKVRSPQREHGASGEIEGIVPHIINYSLLAENTFSGKKTEVR